MVKLLLIGFEEEIINWVENYIQNRYKHWIVKNKNDFQYECNYTYDVYFINFNNKSDYEINTSILRCIRNHTDSLIITVGTNIKEAIIGYEYQVFRFILKDDFIKVFDKLINDIKTIVLEKEKTIILEDEYGNLCKVRYETIIYLYSSGNYVCFYTTSKVYKKRTSVKKISADFPKYFFQPCFGILINMFFIYEIDKKNGVLFLENGYRITISKKHMHEMVEIFKSINTLIK